MPTSLQLNGSAFAYRALLVILVLAAGCSKPTAMLPQPVSDPTATPEASRTPAPVPPSPATQAKSKDEAPLKKSLALVRVYYVTDRSRTSNSDPHRMFGTKRGALCYGSCEVAVPTKRKAGKAEPGASADYRPDLRKVVPRDYDEYLSQLRNAVAKSAKRSAFVFVHGYNVTFAEAARSAAHLKYELGFDGVPIFFSWPSKGRNDAFAADEADVEWSQPDLKEFLKDLAATSKARNIYLIGHSMGNRALAKAYIYLSSERPELSRVFREVILVAPDFDAELFRRDLAPKLAASGTRTTIYSSSRDPALRASRKFQDYQRAGDSGADLPLYDGIETIDASRVDTALTVQGRRSDNATVIADINHLIRRGKKPAARSGLQAVEAASGRYWRFRTR